MKEVLKMTKSGGQVPSFNNVLRSEITAVTNYTAKNTKLRKDWNPNSNSNTLMNHLPGLEV